VIGLDDLMELAEHHAPDGRTEADAALAGLGIDPDAVREVGRTMTRRTLELGAARELAEVVEALHVAAFHLGALAALEARSRGNGR
jgi:hypothetical protein